jgi:hypothetical protein
MRKPGIQDKPLALVMAGVFIVLQIILVVAYTRNWLPPALFWTMTDFALVLICGLVFYNLARGNEPDLSIKQLGACIGGGAAIGLVVVFSINYFIISLQFKSDLRAIDISSLPPTVMLLDASPNIAYAPIHNGKEIMVHFEDTYNGLINTRDTVTQHRGRINMLRDGNWTYQEIGGN